MILERINITTHLVLLLYYIDVDCSVFLYLDFCQSKCEQKTVYFTNQELENALNYCL